MRLWYRVNSKTNYLVKFYYFIIYINKLIFSFFYLIESETGEDDDKTPDALDHYRFLVLIRNQFLKSNSFQNVDDHVLAKKNFKATFDSLSFHYTQLMNTLDTLSNEAKAITAIYREDV